MYAEHYPEKRQQTRHYFGNMEKKFREQENENDEFIISDKKEEYLHLNRTVSTRETALQVDVSLHQKMYGNLSIRQLSYCNPKMRVDSEFSYRILYYSDESLFTYNGMFNRNNTCYWAKENAKIYWSNYLLRILVRRAILGIPPG